MTGRRTDLLRAGVVSVGELTPHLVRVVLGGDDLARFDATGHPDQQVHLALPGRGEPELRSYTVRRWDPQRHELTVDFALHEHGAAVDWLRAARPGSPLSVHADIGWYEPPADTAWWLLVADLAGLPALAHIVETLPPGARATAVVEIPDVADTQQWSTPAEVVTDWLVGSGNGAGPSALGDAVAALPRPAGPGYVWAATEAAAARAVRKHVRGAWGIDRARVDVMGYWRADQEAWLTRYATVEADVVAVWETALGDGKSEDEADELYDEALERAGL